MFSNKNFQRVLRLFPNFLWPVKVWLIKATVKRKGKNFSIGPNVILYNYRNIEIGNNVFIGDRTVIGGNVPVKIGNNVMFGPEVMIRGGDHNMSVVGIPMYKVKEGGVNRPIEFEGDNWIGTRAIILKGVTIGEGSVVGAGALVNEDTLPYSISVGVPCKPIKCRFTKSELKKHIEMVDSIYRADEILEAYHANGINVIEE